MSLSSAKMTENEPSIHLIPLHSPSLFLLHPLPLLLAHHSPLPLQGIYHQQISRSLALTDDSYISRLLNVTHLIH